MLKLIILTNMFCETLAFVLCSILYFYSFYGFNLDGDRIFYGASLLCILLVAAYLVLFYYLRRKNYNKKIAIKIIKPKKLMNSLLMLSSLLLINFATWFTISKVLDNTCFSYNVNGVDKLKNFAAATCSAA